MSARLKPLTPELSAVHRFGALLRRLRIEARLSQPELSARLYISKSTLSRAETGVRLLPRDLAEACDELLGASGALLAAWQHASSAPRAVSQSERTRHRSSVGHCIPGLCGLALRARSAQVGGPGQSSRATPSVRPAETFPAPARTVDGWRGRDRPLSPGRAEPGRYPLPPAGDGLPDPPPADVSLPLVGQSRPEARGTSLRGTAGDGIRQQNRPSCQVAAQGVIGESAQSPRHRATSSRSPPRAPVRSPIHESATARPATDLWDCARACSTRLLVYPHSGELIMPETRQGTSSAREAATATPPAAGPHANLPERPRPGPGVVHERDGALDTAAPAGPRTPRGAAALAHRLPGAPSAPRVRRRSIIRNGTRALAAGRPTKTSMTQSGGDRRVFDLACRRF